MGGVAVSSILAKLFTTPILKNTSATVTCLMIGALLAPVANYAADYSSTQEKPVTIVKDSVITTKIKSKLTAEKLTFVKDIKVDTDNDGVVTLSGKVATQEQADKVAPIARDTEGVKSVNNDLKITGAP
ncbi:BON domain-containing protein [Collimonas sp. H4R21]|uniref:BON domain-containing protein n=1 Tax=Collimonas rhizosphaerae TaxID=3126357 RepID=A0ABU9PQW9_9BURK